jgi:DNA-binding NarL/FixJ family response regulator
MKRADPKRQLPADPPASPTARAKTRFVVVDDHPLLRDGIVKLLSAQQGLEPCGEADNVADAKRLVVSQKPDLMLLDLRLKSGDSLDLIKTLKVESPKLRILVISQHDEMLFAERALRSGASGYVMKENATDEILTAVRSVLAGELYFSHRVGEAAVRRSLTVKPGASRAGIELLSDRELQVFQLIGASFSTREIAAQFNLSIKTIETHRENIKQKLNLQNAKELNRYAQNWATENLLPASGAAPAQRVPKR